MSTPKPAPFTVPADHEIIVTSGKNLDVSKANPSIMKGSKPRTERSAPVRNPAFREHEGLKALQRELNSRRPAYKK